jgi:sensor domain CHASE-containing protein
MSLRIKIIIFVLFINLFVVSLFNLFVFPGMLSFFSKYESNSLENSLRVINKSIEDQINALDTVAKDYAYWDDTYTYMTDKNEKFINTNFTTNSLSYLGIDYLVILNNKGESVFSTGYDSENNLLVKVPEETKNLVINLSNLLANSHKSEQGLFASDNGLFIIAVRPILKSDTSGLPYGKIVMIRVLNQKALKYLKDTLQMDFNVVPYKDIVSLTDISVQRTLKNNGIYINANNNTISGYLLLESVDSEHSVVITRTMQNDAYIRVKQFINDINLLLAFICFVSISISIVYLEVIIVGPLRRLITEITKIRTRKVNSQRISYTLKGDLGELITNINNMLESLEAYDRKIVEINNEMEIKTKELQDNSLELERLNKHMVGRELRMAELKEEIEDLRYKLNLKSDDL